MDDVTRVDAARDGQASGAETPRRPWRRRLGFILAGVVLLAIVGGGAQYWLVSRHYESTDDAMIDANTTQVAPRIAGQVTQILFADNQHVTAGQVLLRIDPRDYQAKLDQAQAQEASARAALLQAQSQVTVQQANVDQAVANVQVAQADLWQARQDYDRFQKINPNAVTRQQIDAATATYQSAQAKLKASQQTEGGARAQVQASQAQVESATAQLRQAEAATKAAALQLGYCTVTAPASGLVTHRSVDVGNYVNPGQAMFALVQDGRWVTANFKETQLAYMRPGQPVDLTVDALPGVTLRGKVDSFQAGTGSAFSVLPAENATGNYVKIVQRVPVKIVFDDDRIQDYRLAPGMSVIPSVRVR
ncbi:MAG TPA: HlyD family secretion protein [Rhodopila sp.]|uniref:HlyD family secretion protein n=1 Tax=Rhodopila sp. TaxID=2480087 RepID=UPI002C0FC4B0|nr:HlyD family secretion protein [Rhodopila sp.]HVY16402.1 HlyD family secretion protein [Rhodopila sp.]